MFQENAEVLHNECIGADYYKIGLKCVSDYSIAKPGQFLMVKIADAPLLRRPFSIHRLLALKGKQQGLELLYKVVGTGTKKLSSYNAGDSLDLLGPLGNGFDIPENMKGVFIVGGGVGIAPLFFLASFLKDKGRDLSAFRVFIGCRSDDDLLCRGDFLELGMSVQFTTDDGSSGEKGLITEPLERAILQQKPDMVYACGPTPMLRETARIAEKHAIACQISIETMMACGMGACLGCVVHSKAHPDTYFHVCKDGPVFDAKDIRF